MKKSNLLILLVAVALIGAGAVYFLTNMTGNDEAQGPGEQGFEMGSQENRRRSLSQMMLQL